MASYCSACDVAAWTPMLTRGGSNFTTSTSPTLSQVNRFIQWITADMHTHFYSRGYSGSAASDAAMFDDLVMVNSLGAAAIAELSRVAGTVNVRERTRGQVLWQMYERQRDLLTDMDLSQAGFGIDIVGPYAGGTEVTDKEEDESDTNVLPPRFFREQFRAPGIIFGTPDTEEYPKRRS